MNRKALVLSVAALLGVAALPVDAIGFTDAGAFWGGAGAPAAAPTMLRSAGAGVRFNAGGFIFEVAAARAIDTSSRGWRLAFNFMPGF